MVSNRPSVTVRLIGGLGNQLFQYAAARSLALRHGASVKLDLSGFETYGLRRYELQSYPIAATIASADEVAAFSAARPTGLIARVLARLRPAPHVYREAHFHYDPGLLAQALPVYLDGFWQSERYFAEAAETIRRELTPLAPLEPENAAVAAEIDGALAVSLHVRRGDYVSNAHTNSYHGVCSLDYYRKAVAAVAQKVGAPHLFVFSDDHDWTRENLAFEWPTTYVTANPADRGFRDMQLMARCRHHVIANSSFSWWGAWLNPRPDKVVVAPQAWFANSPNDTRDLIPAGWVRL